MAWKCTLLWPTEKRCVRNRCFHPRAEDRVPISLAWLRAWEKLWFWESWSMRPLERTREGMRKGRGGGEAQLVTASNWSEQDSMADQTHMWYGSKEREGHKQGRPATEKGGWVGGLDSGHTPVATVSLCPGWGSQLSPLDRSKGTPPCALTRAQWKHKTEAWQNTFQTTALIKALSEGRDEWARTWKTERGPDDENRGGMNALPCSRWIFTECHWKQSEVIKMKVNQQGECGFPKLQPPPPYHSLAPHAC